MNEIERLIAGLPRPSPSPELDSRILRLARRSAPGAGRRPGWLRLGLLAASTACGGLAGFVIGRQSAQPAAIESDRAVAAAPGIQLEHGSSRRGVDDSIADSGTPISDRAPSRQSAGAGDAPAQMAVVNVHVPRNEALARFVVPAKQVESLFGRAPLVERSAASQHQ